MRIYFVDNEKRRWSKAQQHVLKKLLHSQSYMIENYEYKTNCVVKQAMSVTLVSLHQTGLTILIT